MEGFEKVHQDLGRFGAGLIIILGRFEQVQTHSSDWNRLGQGLMDLCGSGQVWMAFSLDWAGLVGFEQVRTDLERFAQVQS